MINLSVVVIAYNEEVGISRTLESVTFADEIIVLDGGSTDKTVDEAKRFTQDVFIRKFDDFYRQRNYALSLAKGKWILVVDSDEVLTEELAAEVKIVVENNEPDCAYAIGRDNIFMGKRLRFSGVQNDKVVRLFSNKVRYRETRVHETPNTDGIAIKRLKARIVHYTYKDYDSMLAKIDKYATLKAIDMFEAGQNPSIIKMLIKPSHRFLKHYIIQGGFMDGKQGFVIAYIRALEVFQRLTKCWRMREGEVID